MEGRLRKKGMGGKRWNRKASRERKRSEGKGEERKRKAREERKVRKE